MTAAHQHPDLHELVDQLNPAQAEAVRAVVVQFVAPAGDRRTDTDDAAVDTGQPEPARRRLSFAGTLSAEPELAQRAEEILDEIVTRNAG